MSVPVLIDSKDRDRSQFPSPAEFTVNSSQTAGWSSLYKDVLCVRPCAKKDACNLLFCVKLHVLTIPSTATDTAGALLPVSQPYIFVRLSSSKYDDRGLIRTIDSTARDATFVCVLERTQGTAGGEQWLQYKSTMNQCIRFDSLKPQIEFRVFTREGAPAIPLAMGATTNTIIIPNEDLPPDPPDPALQVNALFEFTPYVRDNDYSNHVVSLFQDE